MDHSELEDVYVDEFDFDVGAHVKVSDVPAGEVPRTSLFTDIEEAKEAAWRDYVQNVLKSKGKGK